MSAQRTFEYEYLRLLIREHPDWQLADLAWAVTVHEREVRNDPGYGPIMSSAIAAVRSRYRDAWREQGTVMPPRKGGKRTQIFTNMPPASWTHQYIRHLRILNRLARGETTVPERDAKSASSFARKLEDASQVVDLTPSGRPYLRSARPDELDGEGALIGYTARWPGLTEAQWASLTPEQRRLASMRFLASKFEPPEEPESFRRDQRG